MRGDKGTAHSRKEQSGAITQGMLKAAAVAQGDLSAVADGTGNKQGA